MKEFQAAWEAKDLDKVMSMIDEDIEIRMLHLNASPECKHERTRSFGNDQRNGFEGRYCFHGFSIDLPI
tara:strand:- start:317 stop:523 length:207 start_codon:yes stop_codon:yes gene_type:complete